MRILILMNKIPLCITLEEGKEILSSTRNQLKSAYTLL